MWFSESTLIYLVYPQKVPSVVDIDIQPLNVTTGLQRINPQRLNQRLFKIYSYISTFLNRIFDDHKI